MSHRPESKVAAWVLGAAVFVLAGAGSWLVASALASAVLRRLER